MEQIVLKSRQLINVDPVQSHPRLSLQRVIWVRILRWVDKASSYQLKKAIFRLSWTVLLALLIFQSQFLLGLFLGAMQWNGMRLPLFVVLLVGTLKYKELKSLWKQQTNTGNQYTFEGIPRDELITYLFTNGHFKREQTMSHFEISQPHYTKIAKRLEKHDVLIRGESNALVLNKISREELGTQLRDNFPLKFNAEYGRWSGADTQFYRTETKRDNELRETEHKFSRANRKLRKKLALKEREEEALAHSPFVIRELTAV